MNVMAHIHEILCSYYVTNVCFACNRKKFRNLWTHSYVYQGSPMKVVRLSMITLSSPSLNDLLVRKKPAQLFLSKMELSASDNDSD